MKYSNTHINRLSGILIFLGFIGIALAGCSGNSSSSDNGGNGNKPPSSASFDSGEITAGKTFSYTFQKTGTIPYYCEYHYSSGMKGKVIVKKGASKSGNVTITMENISYNPSSITVAPGTTIKWVNKDGVHHTVTSGNPPSGGNGGNGGY